MGYSRVPEPPARIMPFRAIFSPCSCVPALGALRIVRVDPFPVLARSNFIGPHLIVEVPLNRLGQTRLEGLRRLPAEFAFKLSRINCITAIMARAIGHVGDLVTIRTTCLGLEPVEQVSQRMHDVEILLLVPAANVVRLAGFAALE